MHNVERGVRNRGLAKQLPVIAVIPSAVWLLVYLDQRFRGRIPDFPRLYVHTVKFIFTPIAIIG
jgi:hypothetical protein